MSEFVKVESKVYGCCDSSTMFILDNGREEFAVNIEIILKCVKFAEEQGKIPKLPYDWWANISRGFDGF